MRGLIAIGLVVSCPVSSYANPIAPSKFVGSWSCEYAHINASSTDEVRSQTLHVGKNGIATATGKYAVNHATGIQADYRSTVRFEAGTSAFTLHLIDYDLIAPTRDGAPLSEEEEHAFEAQVMTAKPVNYEVHWQDNDTYIAKSGYTKTRCERRLEVVS